MDDLIRPVLDTLLAVGYDSGLQKMGGSGPSARRHKEPSVAKRKDSVALYEVIGKSREARAEAGLNIPAWMGRNRSMPLFTAPIATPVAVDAPVAAARRSATTVEHRDTITLQPPPVVVTAQIGGEPAVSISGGRLRLSLNYITCVAVGVAVVLLLAGALLLGRAMSPKPGADSQAADNQAQGQPSGESSGAKATAAAAEPPRQAGKFYLVIQGMSGMTEDLLAEARNIEKYCKTKGEQVSVNRYMGNPRQYIVLSATGFDAPDSPEAAKYADVIETLGKAYQNQGGRYDFRQRGAAGRTKPWFIQWKQ